MITLHRLGQASLPVRLNCDLILTVEANPDTVITLVTGARLVVAETPDAVVEAVRGWRAEIARQTFGTPRITTPQEREALETAAPASPPSGLHSL